MSEFIFLGSGTSEGIPRVSCLISDSKCTTCLASVEPGNKNRRRTTSILIKHRLPEDKRENGKDEFRNILIDCGKGFWESAISLFQKHSITHLDYVFITHGHADAIFGLDDLRDLTRLQKKPITIFLRDSDRQVLESMFPYLFDKKIATGGGAVADLQFQMISPDETINIDGLNFTPILVHHGIVFQTGEPYSSLGFRFGPVTYISDCSAIPPESEKKIEGSEVIVLDVLREKPLHPSHFILEQTLSYFLKFKATKNFIIGMNHDIEHHSMEKRLQQWSSVNGVEAMVSFDGLGVPFQ